MLSGGAKHLEVPVSCSSSVPYGSLGWVHSLGTNGVFGPEGISGQLAGEQGGAVVWGCVLTCSRAGGSSAGRHQGSTVTWQSG